MRPQKIARLTALAAALILVVSCLDDPTGLSERAGGLSLQPRFANAMAAAIVDIRDVRVVLRRPGSARRVVDTIVPFPASRDTLKLGIEVPIVAASEQMELTLAMINTAGDTVFRAGPILVTVSTDPSGHAPAEPLFTYVGTGADASGVRFVEPPVAVLFGQSVTLAAEAFDAQQAVIAGTPVGFELVNAADSVFAKFTPAGGATLVAGTGRASVQVRAVLPGGQSAVHTIAVQPAGAFMTVVSGNEQSGVAGTLLGLPLVAQVFGADELPVHGEIVEFLVQDATEQVVFTQRDTSDADGLVSLALTLPEVSGPYTVIARVVRNPALSVAYFVEATAAAGSRLEVIGQPGTTAAGQPLAPTLVVHVLDAMGNLDATATEPVTVALGTNPDGLGTLNGTLSVVPVNGVAQFDDLAVTFAQPGYTIVASSGALTSATTAPFEIVPGAPAALAFLAQPPLAVVMETPFTVVVGAVDAFGNPTPTWAGTVNLSFDTNPGAGTLGGTLSGSSVDGAVTFNDLQVDSTGTGYSLFATASLLTGTTSNAFDVNVPPSVNAWINPGGGNWSDGANWSRGIVPTSSDTVWVKLDGTYTVNVDVPITVSRMEMGAETGLQTLNVSTGTLVVGEEALLGANASLAQAGGDIDGPGYLEVAGDYSWTAGNVNGVGTTRVLSGGTLTIGGTAAREFSNRTVELLGVGTWTGTHTVSSDSGAQLRILAGASMDIQGDPTWLHVPVGTFTRFEVLGSLTRTISTGLATVADLTVDGAATISTGSLATQRAFATNGIYTIDAGAQFVVAGGTADLGVSTVQGAGMVSIAADASLETAGAWSVASTTVMGTFVYDGAAGSTGFLILSGARSGTGTLVVDTTMTWIDGTLSGTGITRIAPTASLNMNGAVAPASRTISAHTLLLDGPTIWGDAAILHGGLGARIVNSEVFRWEGSGEFLNDLGGTAVFENTATGSLETRNDALGTRVMGFALDNIGAFGTLGADTLRLTGGSVNNFGGTSTIEVGALELGAGTYTLTAPWEVFGALSMSGTATLALGSTAATMHDNLTVSGDASVRSEAAGAVLHVDGIAGFAGGSSVFSAGRLEVTGSFFQEGTATSFQGSGSHVTSLTGAGLQLINFQNAGATTGRFANLEIANTSATDSIALANDVYVTGSLTVSSGRIGLVETHRMVVSGDVSLTNPTGTNQIRPFVLEVGGQFAGDVAGVQPDTLVLNRPATYDWDALLPSGSHMRFNAGIVTSRVDFAAGDVTVSGSGRLVMPTADTLNVPGNFATEAGGVLQMTGTAVLDVQQDAIFGGGSTSASLTGGTLRVGRDFAQRGLASAAFAPSLTHTTVLDGAAAQSVFFESPLQSHFRNLSIESLSGGRDVTLQTNARVTNSLSMSGGPAQTRLLASGTTQRLTVNGVLSMAAGTASPLLTLPVVELGSAPSITTQGAGGFEPGTTVYFGDISEFPVAPGIRYNHVHLALNGDMSFSIADTVPGDLDVQSGAAVFGTPGFVVGGQLRTSDRGAIAMNAEANLEVRGDAIFSGESTAGLLDAGTLLLHGAFVQIDGSPSAFSAGGTHLTVLMGAEVQTVHFMNPGVDASTSHFAALEIANLSAAGILLETPVQAIGQLRTPTHDTPIQMSSERGDSLMVQGVNADWITFTNLPLRVGPSAPLGQMDRFTFQQMNLEITQLVITRNGGTPILNELAFIGELPQDPAVFLELVNLSTTAELTVTANNSQPFEIFEPYPFAVVGEPVPTLTWNQTELPLTPR